MGSLANPRGSPCGLINDFCFTCPFLKIISFAGVCFKALSDMCMRHETENSSVIKNTKLNKRRVEDRESACLGSHTKQVGHQLA